MKILSKKFALNFNSGFTVIELLVSTGIVILILGLVFGAYPQFKTRSSLSALARQIGLLVRQAQVYGLAVKQFSGGGKEFPAYGIHISKDNPREIILFADLDITPGHAGTYQSGQGCGSADTECVRRFTIAGQELISKFCVNPGGGTGGKEELSEICDIPELNITFRRPDPEAIIAVDDVNKTYNSAKFHIASGQGSTEERIIRVWITGQISIQ